MEWTLQQQGFDLCYDKRLYDRLAHESAESVRGHLQADAGYQERLIRFIENHDEPRAAATFGPAQARAAAVVMSTLAGRAPLPRRPARRPAHAHPGLPRPRPGRARDDDLRAFYDRCCAPSPTPTCATATGACASARAGPTTAPPRWSPGAGARRARHLVVVNLAAPAHRRACACRGATSRDARGSWTTRSTATLRARRRRAPRLRVVRRDGAVGALLPCARGLSESPRAPRVALLRGRRRPPRRSSRREHQDQRHVGTPR